jgi:hypothetical protein
MQTSYVCATSLSDDASVASESMTLLTSSARPNWFGYIAVSIQTYLPTCFSWSGLKVVWNHFARWFRQNVLKSFLRRLQCERIIPVSNQFEAGIRPECEHSLDTQTKWSIVDVVEIVWCHDVVEIVWCHDVVEIAQSSSALLWGRWNHFKLIDDRCQSVLGIAGSSLFLLLSPWL